MSSLAALIGRPEEQGFRQDGRYVAAGPQAGAQAASVTRDGPDALAAAYADGYASGMAQAQAESAAAMAAEAEARAALDIAFARLDSEMAEALRQRLAETVMALCEATLVPFAHDPAKLAQRVERAVALLGRAGDQRLIRLNPQDAPLVTPRLPQDWQVVDDPDLARGALRIETEQGGIEDGPQQWQHALAEVLESC